MNRFPDKPELIEMGIWSLQEAAKELLSKELTERQRRELAEIGKELQRGN